MTGLPSNYTPRWLETLRLLLRIRGEGAIQSGNPRRRGTWRMRLHTFFARAASTRGLTRQH